MKRAQFFYILIGCVFFSCRDSESCQTKVFDKNESYVLENLRYGPSEQNMLDLYLPSRRDEKTPVLIFIHGGAWVHGDKGEFYSWYVKQLARNNWVVANMNYRLVSDTINYEDVLKDVDLAVEFLSDRGSVYGTRHDGFHLIGNSAGGHIALLYGYGSNLGRRISSVISISGPTNINDPHFKNLVDTGWNSAYIYPMLLGEQYQQDSRAAIDCSPLYSGNFVPTLLIHGTADQIVPFYQSQQLADSLEKNKVKYRLLKLRDADHSIPPIHEKTINVTIKNWIEE